MIIIPIKWLFHWEYTQHFQTNPHGSCSSKPRCAKNREAIPSLGTEWSVFHWRIATTHQLDGCYPHEIPKHRLMLNETWNPTMATCISRIILGPPLQVAYYEILGGVRCSCKKSWLGTDPNGEMSHFLHFPIFRHFLRISVGGHSQYCP